MDGHDHFPSNGHSPSNGGYSLSGNGHSPYNGGYSLSGNGHSPYNRYSISANGHSPSNGYSFSGDDGYFLSGNLAPTDNGYFLTGNVSPAGTGYFPTGNISPLDFLYANPQAASNAFVYTGNYRNGFYDANYPQSEGGGGSNPLESEFNRLSLSCPLLPPSPSSYASDVRDLQRMRAESAARAQTSQFNYLLNSNYGKNPGTTSSSSFFLGRPISELRGKIVIAAKDQHGCRYLQNKLGNVDDVRLIFSEVKDHICDLMTDKFGNYLMQRFFNAVDEDQMNQLLCLLIADERKFKGVCTDMYGTRAVQKLLEHLTRQDQRSLVVSVLRRITLSLIKNHNGQHVIQHCLKYFPSEDNKHILNVVADNCLDVATDKSGCCVIQQCLTHSVGEPLDHLIAQIISNALALSEHPYGNYVVQYILGFRIPQVTSDIMMHLSGNFVSLSLNKYGSNVVEQCLKQSQGVQALPILDELIRSPNILRVLQDPYGNYVAQCALIASNNELMGAAHQALLRVVNLNRPFLHSHPHGKRVLALARTKRLKAPPHA